MTKPENSIAHLYSASSSSLRAIPTPYPGCCVHDLVREQADRAPSRVAVSNGLDSITYGLLEARSNQLAHVLLAKGVARGSLVGLMLDRTPELIVALLAILKAGGAYLPLDPVYSSTRLTTMLKASGAQLLVTRDDILARLPLPIDTPVLQLDTCNYQHEPEIAPEVEVTPDDTCYVIYTSGSTGTPKGVQVRHRSLVNLVSSLRVEPGVSEDDVVLATMSISFDASAHELFPSLICGGRIEMATVAEIADPARLLAHMETCGVTLMSGTPALWRLLILAGWKGHPRLSIACGGEKLSEQLATELLARARSVWNVYGPTEATVTCALGRIASATQNMALGHPTANTSLFILDEAAEPVSAGSPGELYISGDGVAVGYWRHPELTTKYFVQIESEGISLRAYKTGDRARFLPDGTLQLMGRADFQVKLRGFRIELGEVEHAARSCPGVLDTVVMKITDETRGEFLAAYVIPAPGAELAATDVRFHLQHSLPSYMVPASVHLLDTFPMTENGKVDRAALSRHAPEEPAALYAQEEPLGTLEQALAKMWRKYLPVHRLSRHDNFFELGGDSLRATQLTVDMSRRFHKHCGVASLHQSPTIALYASFLSGHRADASTVLNHGSPAMQNSKLFWIDHPERLYQMATFMKDQPVHSISLTPDEIAMYAPEYSMERLAARVIYHLLRCQQDGRFYIGGFCQNALLAYEVSQQLRAQGYDVPLVIMIDPEGASGHASPETARERLRRRVDNESFHFKTMLHQRPSSWPSYLRRRQMNFQFRRNAMRWQRYALRKDESAPRARTLTEALFVSQLSYSAGQYEGRVLFVQPTLRPRGRDEIFLKGWQSLVADYSMVGVLGDHMSLFALPGAEMLARHVLEALEAVSPGTATAGTLPRGAGSGSAHAASYRNRDAARRNILVNDSLSS